MNKEDIVQDNNGQVRFREGTQVCGICKAKEEIIQFERNKDNYKRQYGFTFVVIRNKFFEGTQYQTSQRILIFTYKF